MKKLKLREVKLNEAPKAPYSYGLMEAMKESIDNAQKAAKENSVDIVIKRLTFLLTDGAKRYVWENRDKIVDGHNKWVFMSWLYEEIESMYVNEGDEGDELVINFK